MILYLVIVHMPHKDIVCPFTNKQAAQAYFEKLLKQCATKYGIYDSNGASLQFCKDFGRYEISQGYFVQLYESQLNVEEDIKWL